MSDRDFAAGASAARNKLAAFLRSAGVPVPYSWHPPSDEDFLTGINDAIRAVRRRDSAA